MCHLRCDYEAEVSEKCLVDMVHIKALPTWDYVKWLEDKLEKLTSTNTASTPMCKICEEKIEKVHLLCEPCFNSYYE